LAISLFIGLKMLKSTGVGITFIFLLSMNFDRYFFSYSVVRKQSTFFNAILSIICSIIRAGKRKNKRGCLSISVIGGEQPCSCATIGIFFSFRQIL
jgi:hypothetical protein